MVIATPTSEYHIERLDEQFECMKMVDLKCKVSINYVGKIVDKHGIRPDRDAVEAVLLWKSPRSKKKLIIFLGFAKFFRETLKRLRRQNIPNATAHETQGQETYMERYCRKVLPTKKARVA